jgi:hypothetical protein
MMVIQQNFEIGEIDKGFMQVLKAGGHGEWFINHIG